MTGNGRRRIIGFDRRIRSSWLDATADWAAQGLPAPAIRTRLDRLLDGEVAGTGPHRARGKTMTVLMHVWVLAPEPLVPLRDAGLYLLRDRFGRERLPVHWGMCLATYPFFRGVAATTGRLLTLQGRAALSQITRRATESWGARSTVARATQRVVRTFVDWGVLQETPERGIFAPAARAVAADREVGAWLLRTGMADHRGAEHPVPGLAAAPFFFPFDLRSPGSG